MKMFVWKSDFLSDWTSGMCAVLAETVEQARSIVRDAAVAEAAEHVLRNRWLASSGENYVAEVMQGVAGGPDRVIDAPGCDWIYGGS